jgi:hypothetical protein
MGDDAYWKDRLRDASSGRAAGSSEPACSRILITIEITDPETVEAYADVDDAFIMEDLEHGTLMSAARLVSRTNSRISS